MDQKIDPSSDKSPKKLSQDPQISLQKTLKSKNPVNGPLSIKNSDLKPQKTIQYSLL